MQGQNESLQLPHCWIIIKNPIRQIEERGKLDTTNTKIHDSLLSWLGTGGEVKLVLWAQNP